MAAWVVDECVGSGGKGFGGFATRGLSKLTEYVARPDTKISGTYRKWAMYRGFYSDLRAEFEAIPQHSRLHS